MGVAWVSQSTGRPRAKGERNQSEHIIPGRCAYATGRFRNVEREFRQSNVGVPAESGAEKEGRRREVFPTFGWDLLHAWLASFADLLKSGLSSSVYGVGQRYTSKLSEERDECRRDQQYARVPHHETRWLSWSQESKRNNIRFERKGRVSAESRWWRWKRTNLQYLKKLSRFWEMSFHSWYLGLQNWLRNRRARSMT